MAAEMLGAAGLRTVVAEAKPSPARKFLMAGKSGLNLTKDEPIPRFMSAYGPRPPALQAALAAFGPREVIGWAENLGQEMFTGSSGRVFPRAMKASPLLRAWLARLDGQGVELRRNWRMAGLGDAVEFDTPDGVHCVSAGVVVFALGGASWARLGSTGAWTDLLSPHVALTPFAASNVGLSIRWTPHMRPHFGRPVKGVRLHAGELESRGEFVISSSGLEGGGIYALTREIREGAPLYVDLLPDWPDMKVQEALARRKPKESTSRFLSRAFRLPPEKRALLMEFAGPQPEDLSRALKRLEMTGAVPRPMDEAISTAGGVRFDSLTEDLEARARPGWFFAGEMLDWDAPTGGYLLTACLATGRHAALGALRAIS
ncbi:TIGR03862 family flavoprotein [Celeribacter indicus]|nr:TIGR03862 family flavoprotein [Celeribacter indicus]